MVKNVQLQENRNFQWFNKNRQDLCFCNDNTSNEIITIIQILK